MAGRIGQQLLLDSYPNASAAYSLRLLRAAYTGSAIRVRRSSDNVERDIGFSRYGLDEASLNAFVGAGSGFVVTWYDQSGNNFNATQTTQASQPRIVNIGTVDIQNNRPAIFFDGSNDRFVTAITSMDINSGDNVSSFNVVRTSVVNNFKVITSKFDRFVGQPVTTEDGWEFRVSNSGRMTFVGSKDGSATANNIINYTSTTTEVANTQRLFSWFANGGSLTTGINIFGNGTEFSYTISGNVNALDPTDYVIYIGTTPFEGIFYYHWSGTMQEIILYNTDRRINRTGIENNINNYYRIY